jgi:hypothetical protein
MTNSMKADQMTQDQPLSEVIGSPVPGRHSGDATSWEQALSRLNHETTYWAATVRPDGHPHVRPVLGLWLHGLFYTSTSPGSRKGRNLQHDDRYVISVSSSALPAIDLVVEGVAARVLDEIELLTVAQAYDGKYGWDVEVQDGALYGEGAPTAGPPPYHVYRVTPTVAYGFPGADGADPHRVSEHGIITPTRWTFP